MKIFLKENWSEQFIYGDKSPGFFVGRKQEIKNIKNILLNNDSSSILISSIRGIGKTSFIHKALSEINNKSKNAIYPIFVDIGNALSNEDYDEAGNKINKNQKRAILISLIRAIRFNANFKKDKELRVIYEKCFGTYIKEKVKENNKSTSKKLDLRAEASKNGPELFKLLGIFTVGVGITQVDAIARIIFSIIGVFTFLISFNYTRSWFKSDKNKITIIKDGSTELLEIDFEEWLKKQKRKNKKKIVFIIDELDKIDEENSFKIIKEFKNLFTRSFAHFIFIAGPKAFSLVSKDREATAEQGGTFPTLFTHVFYLPLPRSNELKDYLNKIFKKHKNYTAETLLELQNYLLFRSNNDFFDLKKLISDVIYYDSADKPCISIRKIKKGDINFSRISKLFEYIDKHFLERELKELKKYWQENSNLQKEIFKFLNLNFNRNFVYNSYKGDVINKEKFYLFLKEIGAIEEKEGEEEQPIEYYWTLDQYKRGVNATLLKSDRKLISIFDKLIAIANNIDDLSRDHKNEPTEGYDTIIKGNDGEDFSEINLYSTYEDYSQLYTNIKTPSERIKIKTDTVEEATDIIEEQIKNVSQKYYTIFINLLSHVFSSDQDVFKNELITSESYNVSGVFNTIPELIPVLEPYENAVYGREDKTKYVLIIKNLEDTAKIKNSLKVIQNNKNILIINLIESEENKIYSPKINKNQEEGKKDKLMPVDNFINFKFNDFKQFSKMLVKIEDHLTK